jgi:GNAT superfamily N-acetyltransferase
MPGAGVGATSDSQGVLPSTSTRRCVPAAGLSWPVGRFVHSYHFVRYRDEHKQLVSALQQHLWSPDVRLNADYLDWKYHRNPYIREPLIYMAFSGDRLVGMRGASGTRWEVGESQVQFVLPYADDLVVDPAHRVQGLHRRMMEFGLDDLARRGFPYVINLSASKVTALGSLRMKWRRAGGVQPVQRRVPSAKVLDRLADQMRRWHLLWRWADDVATVQGPSGERLFHRLDKCLATASNPRQGRSLFISSLPLAREMADLVARLPVDGRIRHVRDETYFNWRFSNPMRSYRFIYVGSEGIEGYLVLHRSLGYVSDRVRIVDLEAENDRTREELLEAVVNCGAFPNLRAWAAAMPRPAAAALHRHGFEQVDGEYEKSILVRSLVEDELKEPWSLGGRPIDEALSWDLRMIYSMEG